MLRVEREEAKLKSFFYNRILYKIKQQMRKKHEIANSCKLIKEKANEDE